ncbi:hypothetical protein [Agrobacterium tumefaciens]
MHFNLKAVRFGHDGASGRKILGYSEGNGETGAICRRMEKL